MKVPHPSNGFISDGNLAENTATREVERFLQHAKCRESISAPRQTREKVDLTRTSHCENFFPWKLLSGEGQSEHFVF